MSEMEEVPQAQLVYSTPEEPSFWGKVASYPLSFIKNRPGLMLTVILPTSIVAFYLLVIATPQYISETHFMVRGGGLQKPSLSNLIASAGADNGDTNTYAVQDYMMSRDALREMLKTQNIAALYKTNNADFIARFPNFYMRRDFESFFKYYKRHVIAEQDSATFLSILRVRTFSPQDSQNLAKALLKSAEHLINDMNARQRDNLLQAAQKEVNTTLKEISKIQEEMAKFRDRRTIIDPQQQSTLFITTEYSLRNQLIALQMQLSQTQHTAPGSPMIAAYQQQIKVIKEAISNAASKVTGHPESLVPKLTEYDDLMTRRQVLNQVLEVQETSLETAREEANRQMIFLDEVTQPNLPDYPEYPRNIMTILFVFGCLYVSYIMGRLLIAGAREHSLS